MRSAPTAIPALKAIAQQAIERGAFLEALAYYDQIVRAQPFDAHVHYARGTVLRRLHRLSEALAALEKSAELSNAAPPQFETADLLIAAGRPEEALPFCEKALATDPTGFHPNQLMAKALEELRRSGEAQTFWGAAERSEPAPGLAALTRAMYLANNGLFAEAEAVSRRAIELAPTGGRAYYSLLASRRVTEADRPTIDRLQQLVDRKDLPTDDRVEMLYALGKAHDNLADYEQAMAAFDKANELQKRRTFGGRPFDRNQLRQIVDRQIEMLDRPAQKTEPIAPTPIFVVGMPRSGTTLVDQILSSHPQIGSVGEQAFWMDYQQYPLAQRGQLRSMYRDLIAFLAPGFPFVVDKNPTNLFVAGLIRAAFPGAKIIGLKRDPVDTALSMWTTLMQTQAPFAFDRVNIVCAFKECRRLMEQCRQSIPADRYMEICYENLAQNPEESTRAMLEFIGVDWDDRCAHPELNARSVSTPSFWQVRQPVYRTSVGRKSNYGPYLGVFAELE